MKVERKTFLVPNVRLLLMLALIVHATHAELISRNDKPATRCPQLVGKSGKHHWEVDQFLGRWKGIELYSHAESQIYDDDCLFIKITEINESADKSDPRQLQIEFKYSTHSEKDFAVVNNTNVGIWNGQAAIVQVLRATENELLITLCENLTPKVYTILLVKNIEEDEKLLNSQSMSQSIMKVRNLKVLSSSSLQSNCSAENEIDSDGSAGSLHHVSVISIALMILTARILIA